MRFFLAFVFLKINSVAFHYEEKLPSKPLSRGIMNLVLECHTICTTLIVIQVLQQLIYHQINGMQSYALYIFPFLSQFLKT